jgi:hypothetical protein
MVQAVKLAFIIIALLLLALTAPERLCTTAAGICF